MASRQPSEPSSTAGITSLNADAHTSDWNKEMYREKIVHKMGFILRFIIRKILSMNKRKIGMLERTSKPQAEVELRIYPSKCNSEYYRIS